MRVSPVVALLAGVMCFGGPAAVVALKAAAVEDGGAVVHASESECPPVRPRFTSVNGAAVGFLALAAVAAGPPSSTGLPRSRCRIAAAVVLLCIGGLMVALQAAVNTEAAHASLVPKHDWTQGYEDLRMDDPGTLVEKIWWPGCNYKLSLADGAMECGPCFNLQRLITMKEFLEKHKATAKEVEFSSKAKGKHAHSRLKGWLLPGKNFVPNQESTAPRVVLPHGNDQSMKSFRPQVVAYMLRDSGFDVLVFDSRNGTDTEVHNWGETDALDLLGAWEYLQGNEYLGKVAPGKVGIMGNSRGGLAALTAMGMNSQVPALWVDSPPFSPKDAVRSGINSLLGFMAPVVAANAWKAVETAAKARCVDVGKYTPAKELPTAPNSPKRPIFAVHNRKDSTVGFYNHDKLATLVKQLPQYNWKSWVTEGDCNGDAHATDMLREFDTYHKLLCEFFRDNLGANQKDREDVSCPD